MKRLDGEVPFYRPPRPHVHNLMNMVKQMADSRVISNGPLCRELEDLVRDYYDARYALSCSSCTVGLSLALQALKRLTGAKTAYLPAFTWWSTEWAVKAAELNRAFIDVDPKTWLMLPSGKKGEICVPVATFGAGIDGGEYEGTVLVDGAHAFGTPIDISSIAGIVMSFSPSKVLTCGEGGMLLTDDSQLAFLFAELRDRFGRMSEANAAMGICHWEGVDAYLRDRRLRWEKYLQCFKSPQEATISNRSVAAFRVPNRTDFMNHMKLEGVETRAYYAPLAGGLKNTDALSTEVVCLPNWYGCPTEKVIDAVKKYGAPI